jgi:hypothetical protein
MDGWEGKGCDGMGWNGMVQFLRAVRIARVKPAPNAAFLGTKIEISVEGGLHAL